MTDKDLNKLEQDVKDIKRIISEMTLQLAILKSGLREPGSQEASHYDF